MALPANTPAFVEADFRAVEAESFPRWTAALKDFILVGGISRRRALYLALAGVAMFLLWTPSMLAGLAMVGFALRSMTILEFGLRYLAAIAAQALATIRQKHALLKDIESDFEVEIPPELEREERYAPEVVWRHRASFGITPLWFRRRPCGWQWSSELVLWQSAGDAKRCHGGFGEGIKLAPSNVWLLRRLLLRDQRERLKPSRAHRPPPPLDLPATLPADVPPAYTCPISHCVMRDPVSTPVGVSYDRAPLLQWLRARGTDPHTSLQISTDDLYPNLALRGLISAWASEHSEAPPPNPPPRPHGHTGTLAMEDTRRRRRHRSPCRR